MDFLIGNVDFGWDASFLAEAPHFHSLHSLQLCCEGLWFHPVQVSRLDKVVLAVQCEMLPAGTTTWRWRVGIVTWSWSIRGINALWYTVCGLCDYQIVEEHLHRQCRYYECWKHMQYVAMFCVQVLRADERVLAVQAVQSTHLRHHPCQTGAAVLFRQQPERRLLLWHQQTQWIDCILLHPVTRSNSPDGNRRHTTTSTNSVDKLHCLPHKNTEQLHLAGWTQKSPCTLRHQPANELHCLPHYDTKQIVGWTQSSSTPRHQPAHLVGSIVFHTVTPTISPLWTHLRPHYHTVRKSTDRLHRLHAVAPNSLLHRRHHRPHHDINQTKGETASFSTL